MYVGRSVYEYIDMSTKVQRPEASNLSGSGDGARAIHSLLTTEPSLHPHGVYFLSVWAALEYTAY